MDLVLPEDQRTLELTGTVWNDDQTSSALQKNISRMTVFFFSHVQVGRHLVRVGLSVVTGKFIEHELPYAIYSL